MVLRSLRVKWFLCVLALLLLNFGCTSLPQDNGIICPAKTLPVTTPWDLVGLSEAPEYELSDRESPVYSLYYEGENYKDKPTRVFAYYASPATLSSKSTDDTTYPAVVLVHGGGGTAFKEWVELWAKRGYAAIAMDLAGCGSDRKRFLDGGPGQSDEVKFGDIEEPIEDQWTYHAVANVILAHSLIRSFKEVDASRTAVTGISWGGYLTCIVAGLDNRFKAAVPVYGCGFLHENSAWLNWFAKMSPQKQEKWVELWDPSKYIGSSTMPLFFINGTNDFAYPLDSYAKTYGLVKGKRNLRITVKMPHGHLQGWAPKEIGFFLDQYLKDGIPLPTVLSLEKTAVEFRATVESQSNLSSAKIHYTTGTEPINKLTWNTIPARIDGRQIIAPLPQDEARIWFFTVSDNRGAIVSSELVFSMEK